ncbi:hypothetical protein AURDEDRAFT_178423 [Auricularia subglabra TFB-10046 SS5]|uniref:Uncharacterized protein n=1 Tax=Auricularia subglabra (strain TFB-10046 / SS5) TaxID=717982 RepID=J0WL68_AURST|nr:hypothetical protein AURDEDRAFT_178423 [Auricularia subglabra TFB-10046 SS5]
MSTTVRGHRHRQRPPSVTASPSAALDGGMTVAVGTNTLLLPSIPEPAQTGLPSRPARISSGLRRRAGPPSYPLRALYAGLSARHPQLCLSYPPQPSGCERQVATSNGRFVQHLCAISWKCMPSPPDIRHMPTSRTCGSRSRAAPPARASHPALRRVFVGKYGPTLDAPPPPGAGAGLTHLFFEAFYTGLYPTDMRLSFPRPLALSHPLRLRGRRRHARPARAHPLRARPPGHAPRVRAQDTRVYVSEADGTEWTWKHGAKDCTPVADARGTFDQWPHGRAGKTLVDGDLYILRLGGPVLRRPALCTSANADAGLAHALLLPSVAEPAQTLPPPARVSSGLRRRAGPPCYPLRTLRRYASVHLGGPVLRRPALSTSANIGAGHAHTLLLASMPEPAQTPPEPHCSPIDFPP